MTNYKGTTFDDLVAGLRQMGLSEVVLVARSEEGRMLLRVSEGMKSEGLVDMLESVTTATREEMAVDDSDGTLNRFFSFRKNVA